MNREDKKTCDTPPSCPGNKDDKMIQISPDTMALCSLVSFFFCCRKRQFERILIYFSFSPVNLFIVIARVSHSLSQSSQFLTMIQTGNKVLPLLCVILMVSDDVTITSASVVML